MEILRRQRSDGRRPPGLGVRVRTAAAADLRPAGGPDGRGAQVGVSSSRSAVVEDLGQGTVALGVALLVKGIEGSRAGLVLHAQAESQSDSESWSAAGPSTAGRTAAGRSSEPERRSTVFNVWSVASASQASAILIC